MLRRMLFGFIVFLASVGTYADNNKGLEQLLSQKQVAGFDQVMEVVLPEDQLLPEHLAIEAQSITSSAQADLLPAEIGGFLCNVSHTPDDDVIWSINLFNLNNGLHSSKIIFATNKNRKIQSVSCTPNGRDILFSMKDSQRGDYEIYSMDLTEAEVVQLTDNDTDDVDVSMSEDGLTKTWQGRLVDGRQAITLRTHTSRTEFTQKTLASASPFVQPALSANGEWLVLVQLRNNFILNRYDIKNNKWKSIKSVPRRIKIYHPSISNDGNIIGWMERKNQKRYYIKNIEENTIQKLLDYPGQTHEHKTVTYQANIG